MSRFRGKMLVVLSLLFVGTLAYAANVEVTLGPPSQTIRRGERPLFIVTVKAVSAPERVLRFSERSDFRANYAHLVVTRNGTLVRMLQAISDPGPTSERDYITVRPGEALAFQHDGEPFAFSELPPATYSVVVELRTDWRVDAIVSNPVSFTVDQR